MSSEFAAALAQASETPRMALAPSRLLFGVPSRSIMIWSSWACCSTSRPLNASKISPLTAPTALVTPLPRYRALSPSRSSTASWAPVEAPEGTPARPRVPSSSTTSTSTVGLPRLSRISRPMISMMAVMALPYRCSMQECGQRPLFRRLSRGPTAERKALPAPRRPITGQASGGKAAARQLSSRGGGFHELRPARPATRRNRPPHGLDSLGRLPAGPPRPAVGARRVDGCRHLPELEPHLALDRRGPGGDRGDHPDSGMVHLVDHGNRRDQPAHHLQGRLHPP